MGLARNSSALRLFSLSVRLRLVVLLARICRYLARRLMFILMLLL